MDKKISEDYKSPETKRESKSKRYCKRPSIDLKAFLFCSTKHFNKKKEASLSDFNTVSYDETKPCARVSRRKARVGITVESICYFGRRYGDF